MSRLMVLTVLLAVQANGVNRAIGCPGAPLMSLKKKCNQHNRGQSVHQLLVVALTCETPNTTNEATLWHTYSSQSLSYPL